MNIVPVYVFNEHNEANYYWHAARADGHIQKAIDVIHIDAHHDMGRPSHFRNSIYFRGSSKKDELDFFARFARDELTIGNFIIPAVLSGLVRNVYFVFPKWRKIKKERKKFSVSSAFGEGKVLKYGIKIDSALDPSVAKSFPDLKSYSFFSMQAGRLPKNREVILDIDLDYFACRDSIANHMSYKLEVTQEQFQKREVFFSDKTLPFSGLQFDFLEKDGRFFANIGVKKGPDISYLPTEEEIENEIDALVNLLKEKRIRPAVVTICRSCDSGFCPPEFARFIEPKLLAKLQFLIGG